MKSCGRIAGLWIAYLALAQAQPFPKAPAEQIKAEFTDINRKVLDMAKDFPATNTASV